MKNLLKIIFGKNLTKLRGKPEISKTREVSIPPIREVTSHLFSVSQKPGNREPTNHDQKTDNRKLITDSLVCPYCFSKNFIKRGFRRKKLERVQLYLCLSCQKTFTPQITKGKHYPLATIFDAVSLYNLGYSLEESCRRVNKRKWEMRNGKLDNETGNGKRDISLQKISLPNPASHIPPLTSCQLQPSTLSNWLSEFKEMMPFGRMRDFMMQKYTPQNSVVTATLAHQQLYRYRFHRAKCAMVMAEHFHHSFFKPLKEFLELVPSECPHQFFSEGLRASDAPLTFSKTAMIVRGKTNFATKIAAFVLQSVKERKDRHEALQKFMLYNDSVTVATEVPVYITRDDLEHMKSQLGFEIYQKANSKHETRNSKQIQNSNDQKDSGVANAPQNDVILACPESISNFDIRISDLPKLITGHIDILQIRNGQIHILDYKPNAERERPIEQLTLYAMALSRLTGLRLFEFKCAWFDEKDYFEFFPLHVLHKPYKGRRRRKVYTMEGIYQINKNKSKIENVRPISEVGS